MEILSNNYELIKLLFYFLMFCLKKKVADEVPYSNTARRQKFVFTAVRAA